MPWVFAFFVLNLVAIGFLQSIERVAPAMMFALLRGVLFMVPCFMLLPELMGIRGIWLAMPLTEAATFIIVVAYTVVNRKKFF